MSAFHAAFLAERAACRAVIRWRALYSRCRPRMAALGQAAGDRLHYRLKDYGYAAEDAHNEAIDRLDLLWDRLSRQLPPAATLTDADAFLVDTSMSDAAIFLEAILDQDLISGPDTLRDYLRNEEIDGRMLIDEVLLRRGLEQA